MARPDVRIRIRGNVIRIRIGEACIRTVIRIAAEVNPTRATNLYFSLKEEPVPVPTQRDTSWELIHFLNLLQDVKDVSRTRKELLRIRFGSILVKFDFHQRLTFRSLLLAELCRDILNEVNHPECRVHQFRLGSFIAIKTPIVLIPWNIQEIK